MGILRAVNAVWLQPTALYISGPDRGERCGFKIDVSTYTV
jgi:hypothetical protein